MRGIVKELAFASLFLSVAFVAYEPASPQVSNSYTEGLTQQVAHLAADLAQQQQQLKQSQMQIDRLQQQLAVLQEQLAAANPMQPAMADEAAAALDRQVQALRERQEMQGAEIATHEQTKVETESKYPVTLTGLILANVFSNTAGVDDTTSPSLAAGGVGATGISLRQTVLGFDARGPHLAKAVTHGDVRVDFFGSSTGSASAYGGYGAGLLRLRTAHMMADWNHAGAFLMLDRPIFSPDTPTSLSAVAQPALSWSGNLWNWVPQVGGSYRHSLGSSTKYTLQGALIDVPDAPSPATLTAATSSGSLGEQSRWPGMEARAAYTYGDDGKGFRLGAGGYFSPHTAPGYFHYDAWAATVDYQVALSRFVLLNGAFYRGVSLGGLGGGAYKDYVYSISKSGQFEFERPLDDVGGWSQLKLRTGQRLEWNAAYGLDNAFASELRPYALPSGGIYGNLIRNSTVTGNGIYSPTAYTSFSFEYRRLDSTPVTGAPFTADIFGVAAGYKF